MVGYDLNYSLCFSESLSVLVNGCPIEEISVQKGLKQEYPVPPILFLIVEGLSAYLNRMILFGIFEVFKFWNKGLQFFHH